MDVGGYGGKSLDLDRYLIVPNKCIEEGILEAKPECYPKDKVKSPPFF